MRGLVFAFLLACATMRAPNSSALPSAIELKYARHSDSVAPELEPCPPTWTNDLAVGCALITASTGSDSPCNRIADPMFIGGEDRMPITYWPPRVSSDGSIVWTPQLEAR